MGGYACIIFGVKIAVIKCRNVCRNISFNTKVTVEISDTECFAISGCEQLTVNSFLEFDACTLYMVLWFMRTAYTLLFDRSNIYD